MTRKAEYQKEYFKRPEVKEKQVKRMREVYASAHGQEVEKKKRKTPRSRWGHGRSNARKRGKAFDIPFEAYVELVSKPCHYCNKSISEETGVGLDRVDNDRGYHLDNVVTCCAKCNRIRSKSMAAEEFKRQTELNNRREK